MSKKRKIWLFLTLVVLFTGVLGSCKNRGHDKSAEQTETSNTCPDSTGVDITELEQFDCIKANTLDYFLGEIDGHPCVLKLDSTTSTQIQGKFYPIDSTRNAVSPTAFTIRHGDNAYLFSYNGRSVPVRFTISFDPAAISGTITTLGEESRGHSFAFDRHRKPPFQEAKSTRYREPQYTFTIIPDIQYGQAKGFWTSYPMEDENYTKMIFELLPKTVVSKKLNLYLDLYVPNDSMQKHPLLVLLHGGAFFFGDKGNLNMRKWCEHFAQSGYVVASVNYRMGFAIAKSAIQQCGYQAIQDAHASLRYLVAHAEEYHIDPDYVFLAGTSAGSITALGAAFMNNENCPPFVAKNKLTKKCGMLHAGCNEHRDNVKIKALANMWGALYDLHELDGQPIPVISFHGTSDQVVPFDHGFPFSSVKSNIGEMMFDKMYGSQCIHQYLDSLHVRNKFYPLEGCGHAPFQEKDGTLNDHYWFIQEKMQEFFYPELVSKIKLKHDDHDPQLYCLSDEGATSVSWEAEGGLILETSGNSARMIWFKDAPKYRLRASGLNTLGVPFKQEWKPDLNYSHSTALSTVEKIFF